MKITLEKIRGINSVYVYLNDAILPSGTRIETIASLPAYILLSEDGSNWAGLHIPETPTFSGTNITFDNAGYYIGGNNISCNVDMLGSELFGVELFLRDDDIRSTELVEGILEIRKA